MSVTQTYKGIAKEQAGAAVCRAPARRDALARRNVADGFVAVAVAAHSHSGAANLPAGAAAKARRSHGSPGAAASWLALMALGMLIMLGGIAAMSPAKAQRFVSTRAAFEQGIQAYRAAYYEIAIPALKYASDKGSFVAQYYLARIYADPQSSFTDHAMAYRLFYQIARDNLDVEPELDRRAIVVAKSLTAVANYVREGLPAIGLRPDPVKASGYLRQSAMQYGDADAQFELAKLYLSGEGVRKDVKLARHFLSVLTQKGHAGAQAFLADLLWRGKYVKKDQAKALALISMAISNAPGHERFWIEDIYQNIYCGTTKGTRQQATGFVAVWKKQYGQIVPGRRPQTFSGLDEPVAERTCANGEPVVPDLLKEPTRAVLPGPVPVPDDADGGVSATGDQRERDRSEIAKQRAAPTRRIMQGFMGGFQLRDVGDGG